MTISLKESCLRLLTIHPGGIAEVGNCPYRLIRPVLFACTPDQLAHIEDRSPHLMLDSDEIWALHLSRDFPNETGTPARMRPSSASLSAEVGCPEAGQKVDYPPNRLIYFETRRAKEAALASASARLRERVQASRSDSSKRKTIFTGQTDYGIGSKKKKFNGSKPWGTHTPAGKTLAEKARQQVKKSAAVYANALRAKASSAADPRTSAQAGSRAPIPARAASSTSIFATRKPDGRAPAGKSPGTQSVIKVVQVSSSTAPTTAAAAKNDEKAIRPTPFPKPKPIVQPRLGPITAPITRPALQPPHRPPPPLARPPAPANKLSSLFIPKSLKPPPPQPSRSLLPRNHFVTR